MGFCNLAGAKVSFFFLFIEIVLLGLRFRFFLATVLGLWFAAGTAAVSVSSFTAFLTFLLAFALAIAGGFTAHVLKLKELVKTGVEGVFLVSGFWQCEGQ